MKNIWILCILIIFQLLLVQNKQVVDVTDLTFDRLRNSTQFLVVLYHLPWCGYCKELDPIFEKTASLFYSREITNIEFGKVDGTINHQLINDQEIKKFPTIKMYEKGKLIEYIGIRRENELYTWINIQMNNGPKNLKSPEELKLIILNKMKIICYFGKVLSYEFLFFESVSKVLAKEYEFFYCESEECKSEFNAKENSYVIFKSFEEKRHDFMIESDIHKMINIIDSYSNPLIMKLDDTSINFIFEKQYPTLIILKNNEIFEEHIRLFCLENREMLRCVELEMNSSMNDSFKEYLGLFESNIPSIILVEYNKQNGFLKKYKYENEITTQYLNLFIQNWRKNELKPFYKSQPIPINYFIDSNIVKDIVGYVFNSIVMNEVKDVVVLFYVQGCESCKEREDMFVSAAEKLSNYFNRLEFVKIDSSKNEVEYISELITQYPSIKIFARGKKSTFYDYEGETDISKFIDWIKNHVTFPVELLYKNDL